MITIYWYPRKDFDFMKAIEKTNPTCQSTVGNPLKGTFVNPFWGWSHF